jgi:hypothetical protein
MQRVPVRARPQLPLSSRCATTPHAVAVQSAERQDGHRRGVDLVAIPRTTARRHLCVPWGRGAWSRAVGLPRPLPSGARFTCLRLTLVANDRTVAHWAGRASSRVKAVPTRRPPYAEFADRASSPGQAGPTHFSCFPALRACRKPMTLHAYDLRGDTVVRCVRRQGPRSPVPARRHEPTRRSPCSGRSPPEVVLGVGAGRDHADLRAE